MTARQTAVAAIAGHKVASTQDYLEHAGQEIYGQYVFHEDAQREFLAKPIFKKLRRSIDGSRAVRPGDRRRGRPRREGMGDGARRHPLHPLVRADDRFHGREARLVPQPDRRGPDDRGVLRQEPAPGRAGRQLVPVGRHPRHVRGPRLHRLGRHQPDLPPGRAERRHDDDPDRVRLVHGRGARPQDPAAALAGGPRRPGAARAALVRQHDRHARVHQHRPGAGVLPDRPAPRRAASRPRPDRPHPVRGRAAQGPGARGPVLRPDPRADPRLHDGSGPRAVAPRHPVQDPPQRGRPGPVRDGAGLRTDLGRVRPQHGRHGHDAPPRAAPRPDVPHPREAVRRDQRLRQAQQLVDGHGRGREPARPGQRPARQRPVPGVPRRRHPCRQRPRGPAPREHRGRRQRPSPGRQRGPAGDHVDLPGLAARGRRRPARPRRGLGLQEGRLGQARRALAAGAGQGPHGPQPDLAVRLHRQQVRVPRGRLVRADLLAADRAQHGRRRLAGQARRRPRQAGCRATSPASPRSSRASSAPTSRSCSRATATPRSGMPRPPSVGCPTTSPRSMRCRR